MSKTIMLIHGAWLNSLAWEGFKARYEAQGYTVLTPDWPYDDRSPAELRDSRARSWKAYGAAPDHRSLRRADPRACPKSRS